MATDNNVVGWGKILGFMLMLLGLVVSVVHSLLFRGDTRELGFIIAGVAVQLFGLGIILLSMKNK
jgi:hypothetical protein